MDHRLLVEMSRQAAGRGAVVLISNHDTQHARELYVGWRIYELSVMRSVSGSASSRGQAREILAVLE